MEEKITYLVRAENDYLFLKDNYDRGVVSEPMCYIAQSICERYLKYVIDTFSTGDASIVMKSHTLRNLRDFIKRHFSDFVCDWKKVLLADGYYFSAMYPGDDAIIVDDSDVKNCWCAVMETRKAVLQYLEQRVDSDKCDATKSALVIDALTAFDR